MGEVLERKIELLEEWRINLIETTKVTYVMELSKSIESLKQMQARINSVEPAIKQLLEKKKEMIRDYNDWLSILAQAKEDLSLELELPERIELVD